MSDVLATMQAAALHAWYGAHHADRRLPWRAAGEPRARLGMVEGLLAQTRADAVARHYAAVFAGVAAPGDWLGLPPEERVARVAPLGLPRLKVAAVSSLAAALAGPLTNARFDDPLFAATLQSLHGVGPYTAAMVTVLLGGEAVAVDANVDRVGSRYAADGDAPRWMAGVVEGARGRASATGQHPYYEVTCAVLDLGATLCSVRAPRCAWCPLLPGCASAQGGPLQGALFADSTNGQRW